MEPTSGIFGAFLARLAGSGKTGETLINRVADHVGESRAPQQIVEMAKANAEVALIETHSKIEVAKSEIRGVVEITQEQRAAKRLIHKEEREFQNIESITLKALPELTEDAKPQDIEEDWLTNFFDKSRLVSDEEMQFLWGKILAGEANNPGSFSTRTVNFIQSLQRKEAEKFQQLCRFSPTAGTLPLIYEMNHSIYKSSGLTFFDLKNFESMGLLSCSHTGDYVVTTNEGEVTIGYGGTSFFLKLPKGAKPPFRVGQVLFTELGQQLSRVCETSPVDGFADYLVRKWISLEYEVSCLLETDKATRGMLIK